MKACSSNSGVACSTAGTISESRRGTKGVISLCKQCQRCSWSLLRTYLAGRIDIQACKHFNAEDSSWGGRCSAGDAIHSLMACTTIGTASATVVFICALTRGCYQSEAWSHCMIEPNLLAGRRSAPSISSATIARKSSRCSRGTPKLESTSIEARSQSGHLEGFPG